MLVGVISAHCIRYSKLYISKQLTHNKQARSMQEVLRDCQFHATNNER